MSLLFEQAVDSFSIDSAALHTPSEEDLAEGSGDRIPIDPILEFATHHRGLSHPSEDWTCLPIHAHESASLAGTFVAYVDHPVRGEVIVFADGAKRDSLSVEAFAKTKLARRLRF